MTKFNGFMFYRFSGNFQLKLNKNHFVSSKFRSEYGAFWKCVQAAGIYVFTQLCKMLVLATFFTDTSTNSLEEMSLLSVNITYSDITCNSNVVNEI